MAKVELKQPVVQAIAEDVKDATSVVLVDYRGLTVAEDTEMRKQLREAGVVYKVCKNTMMKRAFEGTDFAALDTTMLIVTHEMKFAKNVADEVVFMEGGHIVEMGLAHEVFENPKEERTRQFLSKNNE